MTDKTLLAMAPIAQVAPDSGTRTITGVCAVFGVVGYSSAGATRFAAGAIVLPPDLSRVKLLLDHDATNPLGYMESAHVEGDRLIGTFRVAEGSTGDLALAQAAGLIRDHFVDLFGFVRDNFVGVEGLGLKVVAHKGAGFSWRDEEPGGLASQSWFNEAVDGPSPEARAAARDRVLEYNEDDVRATLAVREWIAAQDRKLPAV